MTVDHQIRLRLDPHARGSETHLYRIAGTGVETDVELPWCAPFAVGRGAPFETEAPPRAHSLREPVFSGRAPLGASTPEVSCWSGGWGYCISVEEAGVFQISADGRGVWCLERRGVLNGEIFGTTVLGPILIVAMALQDVWSLHASALAVDGSSVVLVGGSGSGKSTLAAHLGRSIDGWRRAADDILPVSLRGGALIARPAFPQLKLAPAEQWLEPDTLPVRVVFELDSVAADAGDHRGLIVEPLDGRDTVLLAMGHTAAARLFAPDLGRRHFGFCGAVADAVSACRLRFVRSPDLLPQLVEAIRAEVASQLS